MESQTGERSYTLDLTLSDLLMVITSVESLIDRLHGLHSRLMNPLMQVQEQTEGGQTTVDDLRRALEAFKAQLEPDPDGISVEEVGSETPIVSMENPFEKNRGSES